MAAKYQIVLGELSAEIDGMQPGDRLPTEEALAERFKVSAMTIRRAMQALSDAKRTVGVRGRGTFVAPRTVSKKITLTSFTESMRQAGMRASTSLRSASISPADVDAAQRLQITLDQPVYRLERLRLGDNSPLAIEYTLLPAVEFPGLLGEDLTGSLYELLHRRYGIVLDRGESRISAVLPTPEQARALEIEVSQPCIAIRAYNTAVGKGGTIVESAISVYRGDRYELVVDHEPAAAF